MRSTISVSLLLVSWTLSATTAVGQSATNRVQLREQLQAQFPLPAEPVAPVQPRKPGVFGSGVAGFLIGGGTFVGTAALCGKTEVIGAAPYGTRVDGTFLAPGEVRAIPAPIACTAGFGAGAGLVSTWLVQKMRSGGYQRALASYEQQQAAFTVAQANHARAVQQRERSLDSAVTVAIAQAEEASAAERSRVAAEKAQAELDAEVARAVSTAPREAPIIVPTTTLKNPNAVAVVIGNQTYSRGEVPPVEYALRDAALMRRFLVQTFGFSEENIIFEQNASFATLTRIFGSRDDTKGQLNAFVNPDGTSDVFIFYSGHGAPDPGSGSAYLVSSDADPQSIRLTGYPMRLLQENLAQLPARSVTMVLDACFSGLADRGALLRGISPLTLRVENPVLTMPNSVVLTASQSTEVSGWYDAQRHGLFTYVLLDALAKSFQEGASGTIPTAQELQAKITPEVLRLSRRLRQREQTPQIYGQGAAEPLPFIQREP
jgi:hypothetical protein